MKRAIQTGLLVGLVLSMAAFGQKTGTDRSSHPSSASSPSAALTEGEVRKIDKDAKRITLRHGPIKNIDMPAMTMVFQVKDPAMLEKVKAGDKVKFQAESIGGALVVTRIEAAK